MSVLLAPRAKFRGIFQKHHRKPLFSFLIKLNWQAYTLPLLYDSRQTRSSLCYKINCPDIPLPEVITEMLLNSLISIKIHHLTQVLHPLDIKIDEQSLCQLTPTGISHVNLISSPNPYHRYRTIIFLR